MRHLLRRLFAPRRRNLVVECAGHLQGIVAAVQGVEETARLISKPLRARPQVKRGKRKTTKTRKVKQ